jgi:putative proteasome-type protease
MTYCVGLLLEEGLVMIADTRTNAGIDQVSTYRKLHVFEKPGERVLMICTSGNLSVSQTALGLLREGVFNHETGEVETLDNVPTMFRAAQLVGHAVRKVKTDIGHGMDAEGVSFDVTLLLGGQIRGGPMTLYLVYSAGNFIQCGPESPFLQIGETKYGKPIIDRAVTWRTDLYEGLKIGLISFDSTMRSNLGVGLPIDLMVLRRDALAAETRQRIEVDDPYFNDLGERWSSALKAAHMAIPEPPYRSGG